ncbi:MYCBP-associated protein [Chloropicon primus]|uniref:MYCBP-associated protein n=2 Tax=Chloropicon primus TaxID=1764295 RepID=A0A5B8MNI0_9CHLO|nr:MYCBP-associated protein [Chloropicon primus]UPR01446.1 MYCBP-associated protein [Chloropicon primus]|eukprot:QDZ22228.1 MYCBP-associated protein [Chloropicon primus]
MASGAVATGSSLPLDGHATVLDKYMSELDPNNKQEQAASPLRQEQARKIEPWNVLGDAEEFEEMLLREELARREDEQVENGLSPVQLAYEKQRNDPNLPEDVASALKDEEAFAPAIYKAYKDCLEEKSLLLSKVENLRLSRSQQLQASQAASLRSSPVAKRDRDGVVSASVTGTLEREKEAQRRQTIGDKIIEGSQVRALQEYDKFNHEWVDFKGKVSTKVGRLESDLVFERGPEFRRKKEELEMLELAIPTHERHGADQWTMSLRNNWTRYVPVGNIFSGLFCPVEDKPTIEYLEQITKPIHSVDDPSKTAEQLKTLGKTFGSSTLATRGRSWLDSGYLQTRRTQYSKNIAKVRQHSVGADTIAVVGESIESRVEEQARSAITMKDVEDKLSQTNPAVWEMIRTNRQVREKFSTLERDRSVKNIEEEEESKDLPKQGPYLECSSSCLEFKNSVDEVTHQTLELTNKGTTAVKYCWVEQKDVSIFESEKTLKKSMFFLSHMIGVILPGESKTFNFGFKPTCAGQFWSKWDIQTIPNLPTKLDTLVLKGSATVGDFADDERLQFIASLKEKIKERVTSNEMKRIVNDVKEEGKQAERARLSSSQEEERSMFVRANANCGENYFYTPEEFDKLKDIFGKCVIESDGAEGAQESEEEGAAKEEEAPAAESNDGEGDGAPQPTTWDGSVSVIAEAVESGKLAPDVAAEEVKAELNETLTSMKIPREEGMVAYNAFYSLLSSVADKIEEHLFEETEEAKAEAEEAEGEDAEAKATEAVQADATDGSNEEKGAEGKADEEAEEGEGEGEEEEPPVSEAKLAAIGSATMALAGIDIAIAETCGALKGEFEKQYTALKAKADGAADAADKEHLLWELFCLSRQKEKIIG